MYEEEIKIRLYSRYAVDAVDAAAVDADTYKEEIKTRLYSRNAVDVADATDVADTADAAVDKDKDKETKGLLRLYIQL